MTVTISDTFTRTNASSWGTADTGGSWSATGTFTAATNGTQGTLTYSSVAGQMDEAIGSSITDGQVQADITSTRAQHAARVMHRFTDASNWYKWGGNGSTNMVLGKDVAGTITNLGTFAQTLTAGTMYTYKLYIVGSSLKAKVWQTGQSEPGTWGVTSTDTSLTSGAVGVLAALAASETITVDNFSFDDLTTAYNVSHRDKYFTSIVESPKSRARFKIKSVMSPIARAVDKVATAIAHKDRDKFKVALSVKPVSRELFKIAPHISPVVRGGFKVALRSLKLHRDTFKISVPMRPVSRAKEYIASALKSVARDHFIIARTLDMLARSRFVVSLSEKPRSRSKFSVSIPNRPINRGTFKTSLPLKAPTRARWLLSMRVVPVARSGFVLSVVTAARAIDRFVIHAFPHIVQVSRASYKIAVQTRATARDRFLLSHVLRPSSRNRFQIRIPLGSQARTKYIIRLSQAIVSRTKYLIRIPWSFAPDARVVFRLSVPLKETHRSTYKTSLKLTPTHRPRFIVALRGLLNHRSRFSLSTPYTLKSRTRFKLSSKMAPLARGTFKLSSPMRLISRAVGKISTPIRVLGRGKFGVSIRATIVSRSAYKIRLAITPINRSLFKLSNRLSTTARNSFKISTRILYGVRDKFRMAVRTSSIQRTRYVVRTSESMRALAHFLIKGLQFPISVLGENIKQALSVTTTVYGKLTGSFIVASVLSIKLSGVTPVPTPNTTILSTITVTDSNGVLQTNLSSVTLVVTFPDNSTTTLTLGSGITNIGNGQYQAKYTTKAVGEDKELWTCVASDGVTTATIQQYIGVSY